MSAPAPPPLGDAAVRAALHDAGRWSRVLAAVLLALFGILALAGLAAFLLVDLDDLPAEVTEGYAEAMAQAGFPTLPLGLIAVAAALALALNAFVTLELLAFGRSLRGGAAGLHDAAVGRAFGHFTLGVQAAVAYQAVSLALSLGLLGYALASS